MNHRLSSTTHFLTINVLDWQTDASGAARRHAMSSSALEARTSATVDATLDALAQTATRATFFMSEPVAKRERTLARRIVGAGHELAVHGEAGAQDWDAFRAKLRAARSTVEEVAGAQVRGYRDRRLSTSREDDWRFEVLVEEGFDYDSSRCARPEGERAVAVPPYPRTIMCASGSLIEVPLLPQPFGAGPLSVRHTPYAAMRWILDGRTRSRIPAVLGFSAWELDDESPQVPATAWSASLSRYGGRRAAKARVNRVLRDFRFDAIGHRLADIAQDAPATFAA